MSGCFRSLRDCASKMMNSGTPFPEELRKEANWAERSSAARAAKLQQARVQVPDRQNRLLNLRLLEEIEAETYASKAKELRDEEAYLKLEIEVADRNRR